MELFETAWGAFELGRYPAEARDQLRAWDAADAYVLRHLAEAGLPASTGEVVVVGDRWGALATALAGLGPTQISDSYLGREATRANLRRNVPAGESAVRLLSTRDEPPARVDVLVVRVPKTLALLEDQLHRLAPAIHPETVVVGAGMVPEIHTSTLRLFERLVGPTRTTLAVRKARLILCTPDPRLRRAPNPWPVRHQLPDGIGPLSGRTVTSHAGVFCADRLDVGTRMLLTHFPERKGPDRVVDLGCGNGIVGTAAALANPASRLLFVDESHQAVASAEQTFRENALPGTEAEFTVGDALTAAEPGSVDLVLNNPPFHSHRATTDAAARRMFGTARAALREGGELWVVGNRHLGYHVRLRRLFGNCEVVGSDPKFVVLRAVKR